MNRGLWIVVALALVAASCGGGGGGGGDGRIRLEDLDGDGQIILIAFGDSITRGTGDGPVAGSTPSGPAGYPLRLEQLLGVPVFNSGQPGEETPQGRRRLPGVLANSRADYVILLEGVNDIEERRSTAEIIANLQGMVDTVFADGAMPLLGTLTPACCQHQNSVPASLVDQLNAEIRLLAEGNGIPVVDFFAAFVPDPTLPYDESSGLIHTPEGLHPTPTGYEVMAGAAFGMFRR